MIDRNLTLALPAEVLERLQAIAQEAGEPVEAFAARLIARGLEYDEWAISEARLDEYDRTGVSEPAEAVFKHVRSRLRQKIAARQALAK